MEFWELEEHEVAYMAPGIQNVAREWSSGRSKSTKCVTVCLKRARFSSGYSECGPGMEFWEVEENEVCDCLLKTSPVLARFSSGSRPVLPGSAPRIPPRPPCGVIRCSLLSPLETYQSSLLGKNKTI